MSTVILRKVEFRKVGGSGSLGITVDAAFFRHGQLDPNQPATIIIKQGEDEE